MTIAPETSKTRPDLETRRLRAFEQRYGVAALRLACHAAFPLTLTSDLLYCLREQFVPDCPWYGVADVLLSGLCVEIGYDLYEIPAPTRDRLLRHLLAELGPSVGERRLYELQDFMVAYIQHRLQVEPSDRPRVLGDRPHWTALAYLKPGEAVEVIRRTLQEIVATGKVQERVRLAALVETYADLLAEMGFRRVLLGWAEQTAKGERIGPTATVPSDWGIELERFEFVVATMARADQPPPGLQSFQFETVRVNATGTIIEREARQAFYFLERLGDELSLPLEMVAIPGGRFLMGSPSDEEGRHSDEGPQHQVDVSPFFISKYPITQAQWRSVASLPPVERSLSPAPAHFEGVDRPVERVSWLDAIEFCQRVSQATGRYYRLSTEAEWEYACRAGTTTPFYFGATITPELMNYNGSFTYGKGKKGTYRQSTTPVGIFPPNAFGLYDMHGNVDEWCGDRWHNNYKNASTDGSAWESDGQEIKYVVRGGSWYNTPRYCRSAYRFRSFPDTTNYYVGFRVVCVSLRS